jgi:hypothetical protein
MLVLDVSAEMLGNGRFDLAKRALTSGEGFQPGFVECPGDQDRVGVVVFGHSGETNIDVPVDLGSYRDNHKQVTETIERLPADSGRATLFDAIYKAVTSDELQNPKGINTVVVLSAGVDKGSTVSAARLEDEFRTRRRPVQIVAVSYGSDKHTPLEGIVTASFGRYYDGDTTDVAGVSKFICRFL